MTYGSLWEHAPNHPAQSDDVAGASVTWDGVCTADVQGSFASLSNGWKPEFEGASGCVVALDPECPVSPPAPCTTRITYGAAWLPPANHPNNYDDVAGKVTWSYGRLCVGLGSQSFAELSNGWQPYFQGVDTCAMSFRYENCGGT